MPAPGRPACRVAGGVYTLPMPRLFAALLMFLFGCVSSPALLAADVAEARSVLLIAAEGMADPRFRQSVVLVTRHGRSRSTIGVIVNRALDLSLRHVER